MRSNSNPSSYHEKFEELAALAVVGELSAFEFQHFREHLAGCRDCREAYEAFADVASNDLGVSAADRESAGSAELRDEGAPETQESLRNFKERLARKRALPLAPVRSSAPLGPVIGVAASTYAPKAGLHRSLYGIAATILIAGCVAGGLAWFRSEKKASAERQRAQQLQAVVDSLKQEKNSTQANTNVALVQSLEEARSERERVQKERDALQQQLTASESKNGDLLAREHDSETKVAQAIADTEKLRQQLESKDADRERLTKLEQESEGKLREALAELYQARQAPVQTAANVENTSAQISSEDAGTGNAISPSESEARSLFGARDLHIVDVYDVAGDGQTKRTYGRVYYVEKKLLVFYAFDLENRQNHKRGVFQAWGYREANAGKAVNMGLFTMDDSATGRWVLTVNRPDVLSHIDAVFVTTEPAGGSTSPRGKKVLYANLAWPANHP